MYTIPGCKQKLCVEKSRQKERESCGKEERKMGAGSGKGQEREKCRKEKREELPGDLELF